MPIRKPCLGTGSARCSALIPVGRDARCPSCAREHQRRRDAVRGTPVQRGYDSEYRRLRRQVLEDAGWACGYCGAPANTVDHIVPLSRGGSRGIDNLRAACSSCNYRRGGQLNRRSPA